MEEGSTIEQPQEQDDKSESKSEHSLPKCRVYPLNLTRGRALGRLPAELTGPTCPECGSTLVIGGPFYAGPLHDQSFVNACLAELEQQAPQPTINLLNETNLLSDAVNSEIQSGSIGPVDHSLELHCVPESLAWVKTAKARFEYDMATFRFQALSQTVHSKVTGILKACLEDIPEVPFFYNLSSICNHAKVSMIKADKFKSALLNLGYQVGLFHRDPLSVKTDAPVTVIFDIVRAWIQSASKSEGGKNTRTPNNYLGPLKTLTRDQINFNYHPALSKTKKGGPRWVPNPTANWGPGRRANKPKPINADND
eukprot:Protomagalhaensia_sp_Gyna_25__4858@NODE_506_length_3248_cov_10_292615_g397_i0_p1_GENE_NODE_506_length_3248_cov_10_292615_g397_i0NODE_506_length_3248_cov_10_292615_g397_i0_p1_ORF_typecomplete_len310_score62_45TRM/PF02005_16/9_1e11TRM/PF02005_16/2_5e18_NODE_506_length_3248_cov_10_292615_g397_i012432172